MSVSVDIESIKALLKEAAFGASCTIQQASMGQLNVIKGLDGALPLFARIVDVNDGGAGLPVEVRQLAALLVKCSIEKYWVERKQDTIRSLLDEEKTFLKDFLVSYRNEPECGIGAQVSSIIATIMKSEWPNTWPEIIPTLLLNIQDSNIVVNLRAMATLDEIVTVLSEKASICPPFAVVFDSLCVQLYPAISKVWALNFKDLKTYLGTYNVNAAEYVVGAPSPYGVEDRDQNVKIYYLLRICNVIRMVIENSYISISAMATFKTFWKTYVGALAMISSFLRKARPLANILLQQAVTNSASVARRRGPGEVNTKLDENSDDTCDYYIPMHLFNEHNGGLFNYLNMLLKLNKSLACTPVHLQRKYPVEVAPYLDSVLEFYYNHLIVEFQMNSSSSSVASTTATGCKGPQMLPLCYLTTTAVYFLHHVVGCNAYDAVNLYKHKKRSVVEEEENNMEEVEATSNNAAIGHEIRSKFFTEDKVSTLVHLLLNYTLRYKDEELREWQEDSESFYINQVCPSEKCSVRSASECLYSSLLEFNEKVTSGVIFSYLNNYERQMKLTSLPDTVLHRCGFHPGSTPTLIPDSEILLYDAVYLCTSFSVTQFASLGDCTVWLRGVCGPLFRQTCQYFLDVENPRQMTAGGRLLLNRLSGLLGTYADQFMSLCNYYCFDMFVSIMNSPKIDKMIKLTTVSSFAQLITATGFNTEQTLSKYERIRAGVTINQCSDDAFNRKRINAIVIIVQSCCVFISQLNECESKLFGIALVKECIQLLATVRSEFKFEVMLPIAQYLTELWRISESGDPTRSTLLEVFKDLIVSANAHSVAFHSICFPLISFSCTTVSTHDCLLKDGVALWLSVMRNIPANVTYSQELDDLFFTVMSYIFNNGTGVDTAPRDTELIKDLMLIVESYVLIGKKLFFQTSRTQHLLFAMFSAYVGKIDGNVVQYITRPLELLLVANSDRTVDGVVASDAVTSFFLGSGLLCHILRIILASCQCQLITGVFQPFVTSDNANVQYITVVMRLLLTKPTAVLAALTELKKEIYAYLCKLHNIQSAGCDLTESILLNHIVQCSLARGNLLESVQGSLVKQKIWCLALASLYPSEVTVATAYSTSPSDSAKGGGCIFEAMSRSINNFMNPPANTTPVKAIPLEEDSYVWSGVVTTEHQVRWIKDIVELATMIVKSVGMNDSSVSPRIGSVTVDAVERAAMRRNSIYATCLRELIGTSGEDCMSFDDEDGVQEEPIISIFEQLMYANDVAINGNVAEIVTAKLNKLKASIGEEKYRQLNIIC